jgi:hypothetical protein
MPAPTSNRQELDDRQCLRVGVLAYEHSRPWMIGALSRWCSGRTDVEIVHLQCIRSEAVAGRTPGNAPTPRFPGPVSRAMFRALRTAESRLIGGMTRNVTLLTEYRSPGPDDRVVPLASGSDAAERVAPLALDLIVSFGPCPLPAQLAASTRLGVVSVEHDGEFDSSAETAGFWQVMQRATTTGFALIARDGSGASPRVLAQGTVRNRVSFLYNQLAVQKKGLHALQGLLALTAARGELPPGTASSQAPSRPERGPSVLEQAIYALRFLRTAAGSVLRARGLAKAQRWTVYFAPVGWDRLDMRKATPIRNPRNTFLADPFVLEEDGRTFCFVEELSYKNNRGCISAYELQAAGAERIGPVIVEPFHMSFPYLFRHAGEIYMVPETGEHRDIRVYRCVGLPDRWELVKVLMTDVATADTMIFEQSGRWWMLTNLDPADTGDCSSELHVFHADDPLSDRWIPHPMNPVVTDARRARNGGLLRDANALYRVSQKQAFNTYGSGFAVNRIDVLTPENYVEVEIPTEDPDRFGRLGPVHHLHGTSKTTVFDVWRRESVRN